MCINGLLTVNKTHALVRVIFWTYVFSHFIDVTRQVGIGYNRNNKNWINSATFTRLCRVFFGIKTYAFVLSPSAYSQFIQIYRLFHDPKHALGNR